MSSSSLVEVEVEVGGEIEGNHLHIYNGVLLLVNTSHMQDPA